jgi:hypothetical protein
MSCIGILRFITPWVYMEPRTVNPQVPGSSPGRGAIQSKKPPPGGFLHFGAAIPKVRGRVLTLKGIEPATEGWYGWRWAGHHRRAKSPNDARHG